MENENQYNTAPLHPPEIMDRTNEIVTRSKQILYRAKALGFIDECTGELPIVLNTIASKVYAQAVNPPEEVAELQNQIADFAEYYNLPETQRAVPFFGIGVYEDEADNIHIIFAD